MAKRLSGDRFLKPCAGPNKSRNRRARNTFIVSNGSTFYSGSEQFFKKYKEKMERMLKSGPVKHVTSDEVVKLNPEQMARFVLVKRLKRMDSGNFNKFKCRDLLRQLKRKGKLSPAQMKMIGYMWDSFQVRINSTKKYESVAV